MKLLASDWLADMRLSFVVVSLSVRRFVLLRRRRCLIHDGSSSLPLSSVHRFVFPSPPPVRSFVFHHSSYRRCRSVSSSSRFIHRVGLSVCLPSVVVGSLVTSSSLRHRLYVDSSSPPLTSFVQAWYFLVTCLPVTSLYRKMKMTARFHDSTFQKSSCDNIAEGKGCFLNLMKLNTMSARIPNISLSS